VPKIDLSPFAAVLLDLDGTIYHEEHALPGAIELIHRLQRESRKYACISNSTTSPQQLSARIARMGAEVDPAHIYTAAAAAVDYVLDRYPPRPRVFNLSTDGVHDMLDGKVTWAQSPNDRCDAVIAGVMTNVHATEDRQRVALNLLRNGAELVGICADRVYPSPRGIEFGSGAFNAMLGYAANVTPVFCGKPNRVFFTKLCEKLDVRAGDCVLVGDNVESDVAGAKPLGIRTILPLTGVTREQELAALPPHLKPDYVVRDLTEL
jgi:HAD superfamily hydrolase (TIGR01450 family)